MAESRLHQLSARGQSVWIDYLSRDLLQTGELKRMMEEDAVVGVTSNPTIFQKAISHGNAYDEQLKELLEHEDDAKEIFLNLAVRDVEGGGDPAKVRSVASFFVSRVDTEADKRLEAIGTAEALALRGKLAIANARIAYENYEKVFSGERWEALEAKGALPQRCLWASTSTKNPEYRDVLYVEELIGPHTVNTMPEETIKAFQDHGEVRGDTVGDDLAAAHA